MTLPAVGAGWIEEAAVPAALATLEDGTTFPIWCAAHGTTPGRQGRKAFVAAAVKERYGVQT